MATRPGNRYRPAGSATDRTPFLKADQFPTGTKMVTIFANHVREAPRNFTNDFIVDFVMPEPDNSEGATAWPLNKTNFAKLCELLAEEQKCRPQSVDLDLACGRKWLLAVIDVQHPETKEDLKGLALFRLGPEPERPRAFTATELGIKDDDIPPEFR